MGHRLRRLRPSSASLAQIALCPHTQICLHNHRAHYLRTAWLPPPTSFVQALRQTFNHRGPKQMFALPHGYIFRHCPTSPSMPLPVCEQQDAAFAEGKVIKRQSIDCRRAKQVYSIASHLNTFDHIISDSYTAPGRLHTTYTRAKLGVQVYDVNGCGRQIMIAMCESGNG